MSDLVQTIVARLEVDHAAWTRGMAQAQAAVERAAGAAERAGNRVDASSQRQARAQRRAAQQAQQSAQTQEQASARAGAAATRAAAQQTAAATTTTRAATQTATAQRAAAARATQAAAEIIAAHTSTGAAATQSAAQQAAAGRTAAQVAVQTANQTAAAAQRVIAANRSMAASSAGTGASRLGAGIAGAASASAAAAQAAGVRAATAIQGAFTSAWATVGRGSAAAWSGITRGATTARGALGRFRDGFVSAGAAASSFTGRAGTVGGVARRMVAPLEASARSAGRLGTALMTLNTQRLAGLSSVAGGITKIGTAFAGTALLTAGAAMQWESAWAGVTKTVDGTPEQMKALESSLRQMSRTLPASNVEIAQVAENAGQLGVATENVAGFTKTMIDLGVSTNLTADEASTNIAQISNVMGTMAREGSEGVSRFGATLVDLGNNGASTEKDILNMAQRMAGAMATVGGSETDLLSVANALSSMGVQAELGGGVMTRAILGMGNAVTDGGKKLDAFAETAGMTNEEFKNLFRESPAKALNAVAAGLAKTTAEGRSATAQLDEMGLKGTYNRQVMLSLSQGQDVLADSIERGGKAWADNSALVNEANKRYETSASKVKIAWNQIKDGAIDAGAAILPVISTIVGGIGDLATGFGKLPGATQSSIGLMTLFAGGLMLGVGAAGKMFVGLNNLRTALTTMSISYKTASIAAGVAGAAIGAAAIGLTVWATNAANARARTEEYKTTLSEIGGLSDSTRSKINEALTKNHDGITDYFKGTSGKSAKDLADELGISFDTLTGYVTKNSGAMDDFQRHWDRVRGIGGEEGTNAVRSMMHLEGWLNEQRDSLTAAEKEVLALAEANKAMGISSDAAATSAGDAASAVDGQASAMEGAGEAANTLADGVGSAKGAVESLSGAAALSTEEAEEFAKALEGVGVTAEGAVSDLKVFLDVLFALGGANMDARAATAAYEETLRGVAKTTKEIAGGKMKGGLEKDKKDFDLATEAGARLNSEYTNLAQGGMAKVKAMAEQGAQKGEDQAAVQKRVQTSLNGTYNDLVKTATAWGIQKDAAKRLAREYLGIPKDVKTKAWIEQQAGKTAQKIKDEYGVLEEPIKTTVDADPGKDGTKSWFQDIMKPRNALIDAVQGTDRVGPWLDGYKTPVDAEVNTVPGSDVVTGWADDVAKDRDATVNAVPGSDSVTPWQDGIQSPRTSLMNEAPGSDAVTPWQQLLQATRTSLINAAPGSDGASGWLNGIAGVVRTATINVRVAGAAGAAAAINAAKAGAHAKGGRLPRHAAGYRLPTSGPGTDTVDGFMGIDASGTPLAMVDAGEWIINRHTSARHDGFLRALNAGNPRAEAAARLSGFQAGGMLPGFAKGGKSTTKKKQTKAQKKAADKAKKAQEKAKQRAKEVREERRDQARDLRRVNARGGFREDMRSGNGLTIADKLFDAAANDKLGKKSRAALYSQAKSMEKAVLRVTKDQEKVNAKLEAATEKRDKLRDQLSGVKDSQFDLSRQKVRGEIGESFRSGNGLSVVDQMFSEARSGNLTKGQSSALYKKAQDMEKRVLAATKRQATLDAKLEKATARQEELQSARDGVKDSITGAFDLGSLTGQKDGWGHEKKVNKRSVLSYAKNMAAGAKKLEGKIRALNKRGFQGPIIQQVIDEWTSSQTFELADALASMSASEAGQLKSAYSSVEKYGGFTGDRLTDAMAGGGYKAGLNAANEVVRGLTNQQKALDVALTKLGQSATTSLDNALVKSRRSHESGIQVVNGTIKGLKSRQGELNKALEKMGRDALKALNRVWGVKSPARAFYAPGGFAALGTAKGVEARTPDLLRTMAATGEQARTAMTDAMSKPVPVGMVPASPEVQAHAVNQGGSAYVTAEQLRSALDGLVVQVDAAVNIDRRSAGQIVQVGQTQIRNNR